MGLGVLIIGESGTGKSTSLRNFKTEEFALVNVAHKPLPFKTNGVVDQLKSDNSFKIRQYMVSTKKNVIVVDDAQYIMANELMRRATESGYNKFTDIGVKMWDILHQVESLPDDKIVYFMMHIERDNEGHEKAKTVGKMLDSTVTLEGMFSIVLKTAVQDKKYMFSTQNSGKDTVKSPIGLFNSQLIDNDLKMVDTAIREYYNLGSTVEISARDAFFNEVVEEPKPVVHPVPKPILENAKGNPIPTSVPPKVGSADSLRARIGAVPKPVETPKVAEAPKPVELPKVVEAPKVGTPKVENPAPVVEAPKPTMKADNGNIDVMKKLAELKAKIGK